jgi:multicomponent Na+:H+ antiporter subunit B
VIWQVDLLLLVALLASAVLAVKIRDLVATVAMLAVFSLFAALLFAGMGAVDVAFVETVLGSAFVGVVLLAAVTVTGRAGEGMNHRAAWVAFPLVGAFVVLMLVASVDLPDRGDPDAPAHQHVSPHYLERGLEETETPNVVTAVLADYRSLDTLGETLVVVTAALAVVVILARRRTET